MKRVVFHPEAEAELVAAVEFYDAHTPGLGLDFITEVQRATRALLTYPRVGRQFSKRLRRVLVQRSPYGLLYQIESDEVFVVAVAHVRRRGVVGDVPNLRLQRTALRAAAEPPGRWADRGRGEGARAKTHQPGDARADRSDDHTRRGGNAPFATGSVPQIQPFGQP